MTIQWETPHKNQVATAANPRLTVLRLTGFGQTGPYAGRPGFARIFEAMSGFTNLCGEQGGSPMHMNYPVGDMVAGMFGAFAIAAAVADSRRAPGQRGREIDLSATEALLRILEPLPVEYEQLGQARERAGNLTTYAAPSNMYRTGDSVWLTVVASPDVTFRRLADAIGRPEMATSSDYCDNASRIRNLRVLDGMIAAWFASRSYAEAAAALERCDVPFSKIFSIADVIEDPHLKAREAIVRLPDADLGTIPAPCVVPRFSGHAPLPVRTGPAIGEHNEILFRKLGLTPEQLQGLKAAGII